MNADIEKILQYPDNWDGCGAVRVSENIGARADQLIQDLVGSGLPLPEEILPNLNGTLTLYWSSDVGMCEVEMGETSYTIMVELADVSFNGRPPYFGFQASGKPHLAYLRAVIAMLKTSS